MIIIDTWNGNARIIIKEDGTRTIEFEDFLKLEYPLNIDIRVSNKCAFGLNPNTNKSICSFCHESARTDGIECDYDLLLDKLSELPKGVELAIGINELTDSLINNFLIPCKEFGWIVNATINQGHLHRDFNKLKHCIDNKLIWGLGISYRSGMKDIPQYFKEYNNSVLHVIAGIDDFEEIFSLSNNGIKKILVLGEKDFGFNSGKVDLNSISHKKWLWNIHRLFSTFEIVSFDNLALEQLKVKRFFKNSTWNTIYQGEYSFYINAVEQYFSPSSRSLWKIPWSKTTIKDYFKRIS